MAFSKCLIGWILPFNVNMTNGKRGVMHNFITIMAILGSQRRIRNQNRKNLPLHPCFYAYIICLPITYIFGLIIVTAEMKSDVLCEKKLHENFEY